MEGFVLKYTEPRRASGPEIIGYSERGHCNLDNVDRTSKSTMLMLCQQARFLILSDEIKFSTHLYDVCTGP